MLQQMRNNDFEWMSDNEFRFIVQLVNYADDRVAISDTE